MDLAPRIETALGKHPVDLVLKNGRLINVFSGEIHSATVAIHEGRVVGFGEYEAVKTVDLEGTVHNPRLYRRTSSHRIEHVEHPRVCQACGAARYHHRDRGPA